MLQYHLGYDISHIKAETLSDVLEFFFEIDRKNELSFNMDIKKIGRNGKRKCTLSDKKYEELDRTTFIMHRNEIDRQNMQKKLE